MILGILKEFNVFKCTEFTYNKYYLFKRVGRKKMRLIDNHNVIAVFLT